MGNINFRENRRTRWADKCLRPLVPRARVLLMPLLSKQGLNSVEHQRCHREEWLAICLHKVGRVQKEDVEQEVDDAHRKSHRQGTLQTGSISQRWLQTSKSVLMTKSTM